MSDSLITKQAIAGALKQLCRTKPFHKISIADITEACGLNRQTFYYHFQDKFELLNWIYYTEAFSQVVENISLDNWNDQLLLLLQTMKGEKVFYCNTIKDQRDNFTDYLYKLTHTLFYEAIQKLDEHQRLTERQKTFYADFFSFGISGVVLSWVQNSMKEPPENIVLLMKSLVSNSEKIAFQKYTETQSAD